MKKTAIILLVLIQQAPVPRLDTSQFVTRHEHAEPKEQRFIETLMSVHSRFLCAVPDSILFTVGDIDGSGQLDTLWTRVTLTVNSVRLVSWWDRDGERMWDYELFNPYLWISDSALYQYDIRNPWVTFTIGIMNPSRLHRREDFPGITLESALQQGRGHLRSMGAMVSESEYSTFLEEFRGLLLGFGNPENREGLFIWYEPLKRFVLYNRP